MGQIQIYLHEALQELHQVRWPTRQQAVRLAAIVVGFTAVASATFGAVDYALTQLVKILLSIV